jgi:outer membrane lipoprotein SlyB
MKSFNNFSSALGVVAVLTLGACAELTTPTNTYGSGTTYPQAVGTTNVYSGYGVVGGIVGSQVGEGQGKTAATVLGAAGGAYVGHEMEKRSQQQTQAYRFTIRMSNGAVQTMTQTTLADIRVGDRVMIENGVARRY